MKKYIAFIMFTICMLVLAAYGPQQAQENENLSESASIPDADKESAPVYDNHGVLPLPENLPVNLATPSDVDDKGGYLLLGSIPDEKVAIYCTNSEDRNQVFIQYGEHFQMFPQKAWEDPTILPELTWADWDEDGTMDLIIKYLRHEGTYFDGETSSSGTVYEEVIYQWNGEYWTDIHFCAG